VKITTENFSLIFSSSVIFFGGLVQAGHVDSQVGVGLTNLVKYRREEGGRISIVVLVMVGGV